MFKKTLIRILVLLPLLIVTAGSTALSQTSQNWTSVRSKNFHLVGDASETEMKAAAARLEEFRGAFSQLFPTLKLDVPGVRTNVVIFKNDSSYRPFKPKRADGTADDHIAGYFQAGQDANYITLSLPGARTDGYGTIFHEYVHFLIDANFDGASVPPWLNEGLAEYFETLAFADGRTARLGAAPEGHIRLLGRGTIPISELFGADSSLLHKTGDESRSLFYAESWAVVHYLINSGDGTQQQKFDNIISLLGGAKNPEKSAREKLGGDPAGFEKALLAYIGQPALPATVFPLSGAISAVETNAKPLTEAQANAYLGDLLYHTNRYAEAAEYLQKALALDPRLTFAHGSLGLLLMKQAKYAEAKKHLEIAVAADEVNSYVVFNYAYSIVRESMDKNEEIGEFRPDARQKIEKALRRSIALKPDFAESHRLLAFVQMVSGDSLDEAAELANKAMKLQPSSDEHALLLAQIYLKQEKYAEARTLADRLAVLSANEHIRAEARVVIDSVNEYFTANAAAQKIEMSADLGSLPPLILKRSAVTDADIARFEEDRVVNNLNRMLTRPRPGEQQVVAYVERIQCSEDRIDYKINAGGQRSVFTTANFSNLRLYVLTEGEQSFRIECGAGFGKQLTVLTFRPPASPKAGTRPELVSITFVPDVFRLKTPAEMAKARTIIVEDDTLRRSGSRKPAGDNDQ